MPWYGYFVVGGAVFLASVNYGKGEKTLLWLLENDKKRLVRIYLLYTLAAVAIELVGRFGFHLWHYNLHGSLVQFINVFLITYQFAFFLIYELFILLRKYIATIPFLFAVLVVINAFVHEIPNTFAHEWVYTIPGISYEIFGINIVVIAGWSILVAVPFLVRRIVR